MIFRRAANERRRYLATAFARSMTFRPGIHGRTQPSILRRFHTAQALDAGAALLRLDATLLGGACWPGRAARHRRRGGLADEVAQALARVGAVALLGAVALRRD